MSSFNTGFQLGASMYNMAERNRMAAEELDLAKARDARAAEEFGWRRDKENEQKAAREAYASTVSGLRPEQRTQIQDTYGMTPAQVNQQLTSGGLTGLQSKLASYDAPDSYDLQNVPEAPAAGVQPRFTADQIKAGPVNRTDREQALARMALAGLDTTSLRQSHAAQDDLAKSEIASKVMNLKTADLEKMAPDINMSGYPMLYTGKGKNGYTFLKTEPDGKTPIPGSTFTLNESQLRQLALSHELGSAGFGTEAMATLSAAHKDIGDHVAKWNEAMGKVATTNNTATHYGNQDAASAAHADYFRQRGAMDRMGGAQYFTGEDGNTYASIPTMGKGGLQFQTVRVNPEGIKLKKVAGGVGADGKPIKVEEEGTKMTIGGQLMFADGNGGWIPGNASGKPIGVLPSERAKALKAAGISDNDIGGLEWNKDGTGVILNGSMKFGLDELKLIPGEISRLNKANIAVEEDNKRSMGIHAAANRIRNMQPPAEQPASGLAFGPKITYPQADYRMPSIYASPEEWEAYRMATRSPAP